MILAAPLKAGRQRALGVAAVVALFLVNLLGQQVLPAAKHQHHWQRFAGAI